MSLKKNKIVLELLDWYAENKRDLPWRSDKNPYKILLSEIILQQTRVDQGLPYFLNFLEKFPTIHRLAEAPIDEVLRAWQGLGYYSRARNLHKCARIIADQYDGIIPSDRDELIKLPGIGPYTSAAIASFAFNKKEAVLDGNVTRVISRLYGIEENIALSKTVKKIRNMVDELVPASHPGTFNQAIMEFGALHCTPKNPSCDSCGFIGFCEAKTKGLQDKIPYKIRNNKKRIRFFHYLLINIHGKLLLRKRTTNDIWTGLFEFFLIEAMEALDFNQLKLPTTLIRQAQSWQLVSESKRYKHLLSHQTIFCTFFQIDTGQDFKYNSMDWNDYKLYSKKEIHDLPKSILIDRYLGEKIN